MIAPETLQYLFGLHPDQQQPFLSGDYYGAPGFNPPPPDSAEQPGETEQPKESAVPPSSGSRSISAPPVEIAPRESVIPKPKQEMGPPAPDEAEPAPNPNLPTGTKAQSISDLMRTPIRPTNPEQQEMEGLRTRTAKDRAELNRLQDTGSGVEQFQHRHRLFGPVVRALDIAGRVTLPGVAANIPGTSLYHDVQMGRARNRVNADEQDETRQQGLMDKQALDESRRDAAQAREETNRIKRTGVEEKFIAGSERRDEHSPTGWSAQNFKGEWKPYTPAADHKNTKADDLREEVEAREAEGRRLGYTGEKLRDYSLYGKREPATHIHVPSAESEHYNDVKGAFHRQYGHDPQSEDDFSIFNRMLKGEHGGSGNAHTFKDSAAIDKYSNDWYTKQRKEVLAEKAKAKSLSPDDDNTALQNEYKRIEGEYAQRASDFENQKKTWYSQVQSGRPVNVRESDTGIPEAASGTPTGDHQQAKPQEQHKPQHKSGADMGVAPAGAREGRTGKLPDGTPVIVKGGRLVVQ